MNTNFYILIVTTMIKRSLTLMAVFIIILVGFIKKYNIALVAKSGIAKFIDTKDIISPAELYKNVLSEDMRGLICVQFLGAYNIF